MENPALSGAGSHRLPSLPPRHPPRSRRRSALPQNPSGAGAAGTGGRWDVGKSSSDSRQSRLSLNPLRFPNISFLGELKVSLEGENSFLLGVGLMGTGAALGFPCPDFQGIRVWVFQRFCSGLVGGDFGGKNPRGKKSQILRPQNRSGPSVYPCLPQGSFVLPSSSGFPKKIPFFPRYYPSWKGFESQSIIRKPQPAGISWGLPSFILWKVIFGVQMFPPEAGGCFPAFSALPASYESSRFTSECFWEAEACG